MGDQDHTLEAVHLDEELELIDDALFFEKGLLVPREAGRAAGEGDAVVTGQAQTVLKEIVELLANTAVGAVDGGRVDTGSFVFDAALIVHDGSSGCE